MRWLLTVALLVGTAWATDPCGPKDDPTGNYIPPTFGASFTPPALGASYTDYIGASTATPCVATRISNAASQGRLRVRNDYASHSTLSDDNAYAMLTVASATVSGKCEIHDASTGATTVPYTAMPVACGDSIQERWAGKATQGVPTSTAPRTGHDFLYQNAGDLYLGTINVGLGTVTPHLIRGYHAELGCTELRFQVGGDGDISDDGDYIMMGCTGTALGIIYRMSTNTSVTTTFSDPAYITGDGTQCVKDDIDFGAMISSPVLGSGNVYVITTASNSHGACNLGLWNGTTGAFIRTIGVPTGHLGSVSSGGHDYVAELQGCNLGRPAIVDVLTSASTCLGGPTVQKSRGGNITGNNGWVIWSFDDEPGNAQSSAGNYHPGSTANWYAVGNELVIYQLGTPIHFYRVIKHLACEYFGSHVFPVTSTNGVGNPGLGITLSAGWVWSSNSQHNSPTTWNLNDNTTNGKVCMSPLDGSLSNVPSTTTCPNQGVNGTNGIAYTAQVAQYTTLAGTTTALTFPLPGFLMYDYDAEPWGNLSHDATHVSYGTNFCKASDLGGNLDQMVINLYPNAGVTSVSLIPGVTIPAGVKLQ